MKQHLLLSTRNKDKRREIERLLGDNVIIHHPEEFFDEDVEETGETLYDNALLKAEAGLEKSGLPTVADDTGLEVDALGGQPGVYSSRYAGENVTYDQNVQKLLEELDGVELDKRSARFKTVLVYVDGKNEPVRFEGILEGKIISERRGNSGFGYDPIFLPEDKDLTLAEMGLDEKNKISHRGRSFSKFADWFNNNKQV